MLEELRIRGLGVIEDAVLQLGPGLTAVTGETGAGKTMVVTGLLLLFGGRADSARVRTDTEHATVDGRLEVADLDAVQRVRDAGGELDDGAGLVLRRVVSAAGRSRAYVGGAPAPVAVLADLADRLLTVHGQSEQFRMTRRAEQVGALDRFANVDASEYTQSFRRWRAASEALAERTARASELRREADVLAHGIAEIEAADPQPGEDDELATLTARLGHADALRVAARTAHDALLGDPDDPGSEAADVSTLLGTVRRALGQVVGADPDLDVMAARIDELAALISDVGSELGGYAEQLEADPVRLEHAETRRSVLAGLTRKYGDVGGGIDSVLRWAASSRSRLDDLDVSDEALAALAAQRDSAADETARLAAELTARRREAAARLSDAVTAELGGLAMADASLLVQVSPRQAGTSIPGLYVDGRQVGAGSDGADDVEFLLRPHPASPALPISRGASGGELSRVMLALEVCLAGTDPVPTMVFDEVDAGVGGRAAVEVGRRLAQLARSHQVIVVTHLPQVAAYADRQIVVDRPPSGDVEQARVVSSDVRLVTDADRVAELARMLAGSDTPAARKHAKELLAAAAEERAIPPTPQLPGSGGRERTAKTAS